MCILSFVIGAATAIVCVFIGFCMADMTDKEEDMNAEIRRWVCVTKQESKYNR